MFDINEIKKDLYKSKNMAKFSHYQSGELFYSVEIASGKYQFPISTVQTGSLNEIVGPCNTKDLENEGFIDVDGLYTLDEVKKYYERKKIAEEKGDVFIDDMLLEVQISKLSEDLGSTPFDAEMRGSELIRWIQMAIKGDTFIKIG